MSVKRALRVVPRRVAVAVKVPAALLAARRGEVAMPCGAGRRGRLARAAGEARAGAAPAAPPRGAGAEREGDGRAGDRPARARRAR